MKLASIEEPEAEAGILAYANIKYAPILPAYIFVDGNLGNNWCRCVSNSKTGKANDFRRHQCACSDTWFAMCEFETPRGECDLVCKRRLHQFYISGPSVCDVSRDLKDSSGNYIKSVCTMYQDKTYDAAVTTCTANGMKIFNADSVDTENAMVSFSNVQWPYGNFWVEGKSGTICSAFSNDKKLSYFKTQSTCTLNAYFHCEYQSKNHLTL
jgi:hypothetical protein